MRSIATLHSVALKEAATGFQRASALAAISGIEIRVSGPWLAGLLMNGGAAKADSPSANLSTVPHLYPLDGFWVNADGRVSYCCAHLGTTDKDIICYGSVREILNDVNACGYARCSCPDAA